MKRVTDGGLRPAGVLHLPQDVEKVLHPPNQMRLFGMRDHFTRDEF